MLFFKSRKFSCKWYGLALRQYQYKKFGLSFRYLSFLNKYVILYIAQPKSSILFVKGLKNNQIKALNLYNVFSNYGNILKIILIKNKSSALIEY